MSFLTPVTGLIGGSLIGVGAGTLLLFNGDIMGYSGIFSSTLLHPVKTFEESPWKLTFLASFTWAATVYMNYIDPSCLDTTGGTTTPGPSKLGFALGGFLVGLGTKLGNGCTSGHGICGLARYSKRSLVNVLSFMTTGILTTICMSSMGDENPFRTTEANPIYSQAGMLFTVLTIIAALPNLSDQKTLGASLSGAISCIGLAISGMISYSKIQNFLNISALWKKSTTYDPTLMCVMGSGVITSWISYQFLDNYTCLKNKTKCMTEPLADEEFHVPTNTTIDWKLIVGGAIFGVGWSLSCFCPGPALFNVAVGSEGAMIFLFCFVDGAYIAQEIVSMANKKKENKSKAS